MFNNEYDILTPEEFYKLTVVKETYINFWINFRGIDILHLLSYTNNNAFKSLYSITPDDYRKNTTQ